jgi:membrane protease YdiL (CAAX protease family)
MIWNKKYNDLSEATLCSFGLTVFAYFIHYEFPVRLISFAALMLPAYFFSRNFKSFSEFKKIIGQSFELKSTLLYCIAGLLSGLLLAIFYRWYLDISLFPESLHLFVLVAALIGILEELVFRGFIQEYVKSLNPLFSILFSTFSHTGYKCCLFLSPVVKGDIDIGFLALWTIIAGLLFGTIKHFSKSILPSAIAHALFDILVYAEFVSAPWWVW